MLLVIISASIVSWFVLPLNTNPDLKIQFSLFVFIFTLSSTTQL